jgi:hypothetical protein
MEKFNRDRRGFPVFFHALKLGLVNVPPFEHRWRGLEDRRFEVADTHRYFLATSS